MTIPADSKQWRIGIVGYGEVGRILAEDLRARGVAHIGAYDIKLGGAVDAPLREHATRNGVELARVACGAGARCRSLISARSPRARPWPSRRSAPAIRRRCLVSRLQFRLARRQEACRAR